MHDAMAIKPEYSDANLKTSEGCSSNFLFQMWIVGMNTEFREVTRALGIHKHILSILWGSN